LKGIMEKPHCPRCNSELYRIRPAASAKDPYNWRLECLNPKCLSPDRHYRYSIPKKKGK